MPTYSVRAQRALIVGIGYFGLRFADLALEYVGVLPSGWGALHELSLAEAAIVVMAVPVCYFAFRLYRAACRVEEAMRHQDAGTATP